VTPPRIAFDPHLPGLVLDYEAPALQQLVDDLDALLLERVGLRQVKPLARLRRRVRVAPVALLIELQRACCALELGQRAMR